MEPEKIYNGQVSHYNIQHHYGFIECEDRRSCYFFVDVKAIKKLNKELEKNQLPKCRTKFNVGDDVNFKIRTSNDRLEAYDIEYLGNKQRQQIIDEAHEKQILPGYLKRIEDQFFVKHLSTYLFIPLNISKIEIDIDSVYAQRLNQIVQFKLEERKNMDKLSAILIDRKFNNNWHKIKEAYHTQEIITGYIKSRVKGGMIVEVYELDAFLPVSQIGIKRIDNFEVFIGTTMEFKVIKYNEDSLNIILSHKVLIESQLEEQRKQILPKIEKGQVFEVTVTKIVKYGVFVDLGGITGLIHITNLSWEKVRHPQEVVVLGQKLNVVILDFDDEKKRISLGLKQLTESSQENFD